MTTSFRFLFFPLALALVAACDQEADQRQQQDEKVLPDSVNTDGMAVDPAALIRPDGLWFVDLGQTLEEMDTLIPGMGVLQDTLVQEDGYYLATRTLHLSDGVVVVEGEYIQESEASETRIAQSYVNRVRIESPFFMTEDRVSVGMKASDLGKMFPDGTFVINPIPQYETLDISLSWNAHIHYLVKDPGNAIARAISPQNREIALSDLPQDKALYAIVLMR